MEVEITDSLCERCERGFGETFVQIIDYVLDELSVEASSGDLPFHMIGFARQVKRPFIHKGAEINVTITFTLEADRITVMDIDPIPNDGQR